MIIIKPAFTIIDEYLVEVINYDELYGENGKFIHPM